MSTGTLENITWKESSIPPDSSSSETGKETPPEAVHFTVGESGEESAKEHPTFSNEKAIMMVRSLSQDTNMVFTEDKPSSSFLSKTSSDNSLDASERLNRFVTTKKSLKDLPTVMSVDDETLSTDSNSTADNDEQKRKRRKLHFPAFRKNKSKLS